MIEKTAVIYAYSDSDDISRRNTNFFLNNGIVDIDNVDYYFISNGKCHIPNENFKNITFIERENSNFDFGAWNYFIKNIPNSMNYKNYIFLNNSVVGPILPLYIDNTWVSLFTNKLNDKIKIVGCTTNYEYGKHIQSYCFSVDNIALNILSQVFEYNKNNKLDLIVNTEVKMLKILNEHGYDGKSFEIAQKKYPNYGNLTINSMYKSTMKLSMQLFENIFIKPRHLDSRSIKFLENFFNW